MWCPECQKDQFDLELISIKDNVAADNMTCKNCGYKFTTVWRMSVRQEYIYSQVRANDNDQGE